MEPSRPELSLEESVTQVMRTLPPILRTYLAEEKYTPITRNLMMKYHLRTDQGGVLERNIMLLLMAIESPDEFTQALSEDAQLDGETIGNIVKEVNEQIFVPLRDQVRNAENKTPQPVRVVSVQPPRTNVTNTPVPSYAPPSTRTASDVVNFAKQNSAPSPTPGPSPEHKTAPLPPRFGESRPTLPPIQVPVATDLLEDREEPHIEMPKKESTIPVTPRTAPPPENLPTGMSEVSLPPSPPSVPVPVPLTQAETAPTPPLPPAPTFTAPVQPAPPIVPARPPYSDDPYREPIEGE